MMSLRIVKSPVVIGVVGALALAACGGGSDEPFGASTDTPVATEVDSSDDASEATEPAVTEPAVTEPASTEPEATEPPTTEAAEDTAPVDSEPATGDFGELWLAPTGDYTLQFPAEPTRTDLPIPDLGPEVVADAYILEEPTGAYFTSTFDYPAGTTDADPRIVLEGARDGAVTNVGGALIESEEIERNGIPGILFTFEFGGGTGRAIVFFDEPRLYQSFGLGVPEELPNFEAFVNTFEFTGTQS